MFDTIAAAYPDQTSADLMVELDWLNDQPDTAGSRREAAAIRRELQSRDRRREQLAESGLFG